MLTSSVVVAPLPAASVAVPRAVLLPSAVSVVAGVHDAIPDRPSAHVNVTTASVLIQPVGFGGGCTAAAMVGGVLSRLTDADADAVLPATSTAVPLTTCARPSA